MRTAGRWRWPAWAFCLWALSFTAPSAAARYTELISQQLAAHPRLTGAYVLEKGSEALLARAWLADQARESIEVQYFIWSTDNIGILAAEALLRAAERGVRVRVLVDDLLIDAPDESLLALAQHPRIEIRIYNPKVSTGVSLWRRLFNLLTDFHAVNQRMHDKTFIVDGQVVITGGRNMAVEYFDYSHAYNFRDRDVLLLGPAAGAARASFEGFWNSDRAAAVEAIYAGTGPLENSVIQRIYGDLHAYAQQPDNFAPEVRAAIDAVPQQIPALLQALDWGLVDFISDRPGKNEGSFAGGGRSSGALAALIESARQRIVIQSPYVVLSDRALQLFQRARERGVHIRIHTNSLASTDNLPAYSGYRSQRPALQHMGLELFEFRPDAQVQRDLLHRAGAVQGTPVFGLHAKTLVVDGKVLYVGTFNLDPRSENLNTEVGAVLHSAVLAQQVEQAIETDMQPGNSWNAADDEPDQQAPWFKRVQVWLYQLLPLRPLL